MAKHFAVTDYYQGGRFRRGAPVAEAPIEIEYEIQRMTPDDLLKRGLIFANDPRLRPTFVMHLEPAVLKEPDPPEEPDAQS